MKRILLLMLAVLMLLTACGDKKKTTKATEPATEPSVTTPSETEPTQPAEPLVYRNPLNGEVLESPWTGRATAVVINNLKAALPHYGTSEADFLYELETESGITRMLAVFDNIADAGRIGPIRSCRTFFNNIAQSYDAVIVHCGGSVRGRNAGYEDSESKIADWEHLDATYHGNKYFFRDNDRFKSQGYAWEHCLFSNGEKLFAGLEKLEIAAATERSTEFGLLFDEDVKLSGATANSVTVTFKDGKTTSFTYDAENNFYKTSQYGKEYIDKNSGAVVIFRNVMVLYTNQWKRHDGEYSRSYYDLIGEGEGHLAIDGKIVAIKWSRESLESNFVYTLADGSPVTLGVGHTYVGITSNENTIYE